MTTGAALLRCRTAESARIARFAERATHVKNRRNQAVRIPREFELPGDDANMREDGNKLIIEAVPPRSLLALLQTLQLIEEEFPEVSDQPAGEVKIRCAT